MVVSGGWDNTVQIWDIRVGGAVRMFYGPHICGEAVDMCGKSVNFFINMMMIPSSRRIY